MSLHNNEERTVDWLKNKIDLQKKEHKELNDKVTRMSGCRSADQTEIANLKKQKLKLKDAISVLEIELKALIKTATEVYPESEIHFGKITNLAVGGVPLDDFVIQTQAAA